MVLSSNFYNSAGILRWNLGWASPTYAGAFLSTLIPYAWALGRTAGAWNRKWRILIRLGEIALVFLLCKTQSRGALVALVLAGLFWHGWTAPDGWRRFFGRGVILAGCVWLAGFSSRIDPSYIAGDLSIRNRIALWKGCLKAVAVSPLGGCGAGSSGRIFRAWFQPLDRNVYYPTPVNSYLFAGIEYGLLVTVLLVFILIWSAAAAPRAEKVRSIWHDLAMASGSSIVAWAAASIFSTLWDEYPLWAVPMASAFLALGHAAHRRRILGPARAALGASLLLVASVKGLEWRLARTEKVLPEIFSGGITRVRVSHPAASSWPLCHIWLDRDVLGDDPERELRRWLAVPGAPPAVVLHDRWADSSHDPADGDGIILVGRSVERLGPAASNRKLSGKYSRIILIHPLGPHADRLPLGPNAVVILPQIDQDGSGDRLRRPQVLGALEIISPGVGNDIRPAWPAVMEKIDEGYRRARAP